MFESFNQLIILGKFSNIKVITSELSLLSQIKTMMFFSIVLGPNDVEGLKIVTSTPFANFECSGSFEPMIYGFSYETIEETAE